MYLPTTKQELKKLGWDQPDIVLVTGDSYIDSPFVGVALIGKLLQSRGYKVGIIAQPDLDSSRDIGRLGEPKLFWGVTAGCIDSMVANYTATMRKRRNDDYTPGGKNSRRPDRAVIAYSNLIRRHFKRTQPIVLGGIEASLRRVAHYDYWSDKIRKSILFDAKADYLLYGMSEHSVLALARSFEELEDPRSIPGLCYISRDCPEGYTVLPPFSECASDGAAFTRMFKAFYANSDAKSAVGLVQQQDTRFLVQNPPAEGMTTSELDALYKLDFERAQHPYYARLGEVKALETIRFSVATHRGCYGECNFCAISVHEGRTVQWRSEESVLREVRTISRLPDFKGYIKDVGGPTANMYGYECDNKLKRGVCKKQRCLFPRMCGKLRPNHEPHRKLLEKVRKVKGVKKAFVASGLRYDIIMRDKEHGRDYVRDIVRHHVSGQLKIAPEHVEPRVLKLMGKPGTDGFDEFREHFNNCSRKAGKKQFLTYYFIAAHPGCSEDEMLTLHKYVSKELKIHPEQVQIFTPLPSTFSALMYHTERDPFTGRKLFVEKGLKGKQKQKDVIVGNGKPRRRIRN